MTEPVKRRNEFFEGMCVAFFMSGIIAIGVSGIPDAPETFKKCARAGLSLEACAKYNGWELADD